MINDFNPELHQIVEMEQIRHLRRETRLDSLFMVRHSPDGNFSICNWVEKSRGWFQELVILKTPQALTRECVAELLKWAHGKSPTYREVWREMRAERAERYRRMDEDNAEAARCKKWLGKRLGQKYGHMVADRPEWNHPGLTTIL